MHSKPSPLAGKTVRIKKDVKHLQNPNFGGSEYRVEDWWDRLGQGSWMGCQGNPACIIYALRTGTSARPVPTDDEVLYGKVGYLGHLVHISEIEDDSKGSASNS